MPMKTMQVYLMLLLLICISARVCQAGGIHHIRTKQPAQPQSISGYAARTTPIKASEGQTRLQIYSRKTGRVAWSGVLEYVGEGKDFSWSADHTATAMIDRFKGQYRLLVWRAGKGMRVISRLPVSAGDKHSRYMDDVLLCDCVGTPILSPDKRRVLILCSQSQGPASVGLWQLWCLTLRTRHLRFIGIYGDDIAKWDKPPQRPRWLNSHKITYTQQRDNKANQDKWEYVPVTQNL